MKGIVLFIKFHSVGPVSSVGRAWDLGSKGPEFKSRPVLQWVVSFGKTLYPHCSTAEVGDASPMWG